MKIRNLILVFSVFILNGMSAQESLDSLLKKYNSGKVPYTSVEQLRMDQLNDEVLILDAREPEEFQISHIKGALEVGYDDFDISVLNKVPKDKKIVVYCSLGIRSENIGLQLEKAGFKKVENLYGGIFEWKNKDYPLVDENGNATNRVHAFSKTWSKWLKKGEKVY